MISRLLSTFAFIALIAVANPVHAKWYEAESDRFVIYADDSEKDIRKFAENLERYHTAMEFVTGRKIEKPSPSNRVTIFVVGGKNEMRQLSGSRKVGGFYRARAGGSKAFVQDIRLKNGYPDFSTVILLHEYAHHFLISSSRYAMPRWMNEGAAEFFAAATFNKDGGVMIGRPALHRQGDLVVSRGMDIEYLLDPDRKGRSSRKDAGFYGRSWLLYHYLVFSEERKGQINTYWLNLAQGKEPLDAAKAAFGDLKKLNKELAGYLRQRRMMTFALKPGTISIGEIRLRELPKGEAKMMPLRIRSQRGVNAEQAAELLPKIQAVAAEFPNDPGVLAALAEAEFDAGNNEAAIVAADKAIALDPSRKNAYIQKGYALFRKAESAEDADAAYAAAMKPFSALNGLENDHPLPLIYFYRSFLNRGAQPTENARHALERASQLAPFDQSLTVNVATMQAREGKIGLARLTLAPVAANPHGGGLAAHAKELLEAFEKSPEGEPFSLSQTSGSVAETSDDEEAEISR